MSSSCLLKTVAVVFLVLPTPTGFAGEEVNHYDLSLELSPKHGEIRVKARLSLLPKADDPQGFELVLNQGLEITSLSSDSGLVSYTFDRTRTGEHRYIPQGVPVTLHLDRPIVAGGRALVELSYQGQIVDDPWGVNVIDESWVELGGYSGWFPHHPDQGPFTYSVTVRVDPAYQVVGSGASRREDDRWQIVGGSPGGDIVVVAARGLERRTVGKGASMVTLAYQGLPDDQIDSIGSDARRVLEYCERWFGPASSGGLTVVLANRKRGGAYARPGFIVMLYDPERSQAFLRSLAHEVAHLWWAGAAATTWEDWLNESFAEFTALMVMRELRGDAVFGSYLEEYEKAAREAPAIWGLDRNHEKAFDALYRKGPLALADLEREMGSTRFREFLVVLLERDVKTTAGFLETLEQRTSAEVRLGLERRLRN
jgi:hypothetical protein